jgi:hypothetical protein
MRYDVNTSVYIRISSIRTQTFTREYKLKLMKKIYINIMPGSPILIEVDGKFHSIKDSLCVKLVWNDTLLPLIKENKYKVELNESGAFTYEFDVSTQVANRVVEFAF